MELSSAGGGDGDIHILDIPPPPRNYSGGWLVECYFTSTETVAFLGTEPRTATSTFTQLLALILVVTV